jgi:penicillin-binding protein 1A
MKFMVNCIVRGLKVLTIGSIISTVLAYIALSIFVEGKRAENIKKIETAEELHKKLKSSPPVRSMSSGGTLIFSKSRSGSHESDVEDLNEFPLRLRNLLLLSEEEWFFTNDDLFVMMVRSIWSGIKSRGQEGGSGIHHQVARSLVDLGDESSLPAKIKRKFEEIAVIGAMKAYYQKEYVGKKYQEHILTIYMNQVFLGENIYGFNDAARTYFHRKVSQLTVAQQATLVVMLSQPNRYLCIDDPQIRQRRYLYLKRLRDLLLDKAVNKGKISQIEANAARQEPINLFTDRCEAIELSPHFTRFASQGVKKISETFNKVSQVRKNGQLSVRTTLNLPVQQKAESILATAVDRYHDYGVDLGGILMVQTSTGKVLAMAGKNNDPTSSQYNLVTQAKRQPASTFKLFTYLMALESLIVFPWEYLANGVAYSQNDTAKNIARRVRIKKVVAMAYRLGITTKLTPNLDTLLGQDSAEATLLEMTEAYRIVANGGVKTDLRTIENLFDTSTCRDDKKVAQCQVIYNPKTTGRRIISASVAAQMTRLLQGVVNKPNGTGRLAYIPGVPGIAGKTGTNGDQNNARDLWFIGFSPSQDITMGVWLGSNPGRTIRSNDLRDVIRGNLAAQIWGETMASTIAIQNYPRLK